MKLNYNGIQNASQWEAAGIVLPKYNWAEMAKKTAENPTWVHFGAGNIFRGFIAGLQQRLLNSGEADTGIIAAETFDYDIIDQIYVPHDSMTLMVSLRPDGGLEKEVIASIAKGLRVGGAFPEDLSELKAIFRKPSLQMATFTITEKGYALKNIAGEFFPFVVADFENGPDKCGHAMSQVCAALWERFQAGAAPIAIVSCDNCSHNGEKLKASVITVAEKWLEKGFVSAEFMAWVNDETKVSFPWSMIDKITPRPAAVVQEALEKAGVEDMAPVITGKKTFIAPFVNAEIPQYLVIEDRFPNGRPALEKAGVYMATRDTVNEVERMKVTTCLNPLHTALAVYGCTLGYTLIADEMKDPQLKALVEKIGYVEGMPVVTDPGIIKPMDFIKEVVEQRLPNPFMPDTPQRIATDTSQKVAIRFGETIKSYVASDKLDVTTLTAIPLAIAGWLRYCLGVDDKGEAFECSADPMLAAIQEQLSGVELGKPETIDGKLEGILSNANLFGSDLMAIGLGEKIIGMVKEELAGTCAIRETLVKYLG